jgi:hypothetical protein
MQCLRSLFMTAAALFAASCGESSGGAPDGAGLPDVAEECEGNLYYYTPGCEDVSPTCNTRGEELCQGTGCGCNGEPVSLGCGFGYEPFASFGSCPGFEDVSDASETEEPPDTGEASDGEDAGCDGSLLFLGLGCEDVSPLCVMGDLDACAGTACSCSGETISIGCGFPTEPFASIGPCPGPDDADAQN